MLVSIAPDQIGLRVGRYRPGWSVPASLGLHAALIAAAVLAMARTLPEPPVRSVAVDIVTPDQYEALTQPAVPPVPVPVATKGEAVAPPAARVPVASVRKPAAAPAAQTHGMVRADHFYAAGILSDSANAEIRKTLLLFAVEEQDVQICNMEALEQIARWKAGMHPDTLVPYAFGETQIIGGVLEADGGAFRDAGQWYAIRFRCQVAADRKGVSSFEFEVGNLIPRSQWDEHFLNATDDPMD